MVFIKEQHGYINMKDILDGPVKTKKTGGFFVPEKYKNRDPYKKYVNHGKTPPPNKDGEFLHKS